MSKSTRVIKPYQPRQFSRDDAPRVGQRVRLLSAHQVAGETLAAHSETTGGEIWVTTGALCDVVSVAGHFADVDVYVRNGDEYVTHRVTDVALGDLQSIKGRPFVPGADDRRHDLNGTGESHGDEGGDEGEPETPAPRVAPAVRPPVTPVAPSAAAEALGKLAGALGVSLGGGLGEDDVRELIAESVDPLAESVAVMSGDTASLSTRVTEAERKLEDALAALASATPATRAKVRTAVMGTKPTGNPIADALAQFYAVGEDRGINVMLASPPSLGKSYAVREFGRAYDCYLEHGCSDEMDEISTLLGSPVPDGDGGFVIVDGVLTQAVRTASEGKSVLLLLDEILRLPSKVQEWLLSFLTGVKRPDGSRAYALRTRRVLPDGMLETIVCPAANLHIVAATNLGMIAPVEAFWSRWETVRFAFDPATVRHVATAVIGAYFGATGAKGDRLAATWTAIVTESRKEVAKGTLRFPADIRMLERALSCDTSGDLTAVAKTLASRLTDNLAHWSADLGDTDPESAKVCDKFAAMLAI